MTCTLQPHTNERKIMNTINVEENDVNETGTTSESFPSGRCPVEQQRRPGRHVTAEATRRKWT